MRRLRTVIIPGVGMTIASGFRGRFRPTTALSAITRSTPGFAAALMRASVVCVVFDVRSDWLQNHVEVAFDSEPRSPRRHIEPMRAEVMEDGGAAVKQWLDVDELPGPISVLEDALAKCISVCPHLLRSLRIRQVLGAGQAKQPRLSTREPEVLLIVFGVCALVLAPIPWVLSRAISGDENLPEFQAPMGLNDDDVAPFEGFVTSGHGQEARNMPHDAITDQICLVVRCHSPRPWVDAESTVCLGAAKSMLDA
jgi:hypothetical protein